MQKEYAAFGAVVVVSEIVLRTYTTAVLNIYTSQLN